MNKIIVVSLIFFVVIIFALYLGITSEIQLNKRNKNTMMSTMGEIEEKEHQEIEQLNRLNKLHIQTLNFYGEKKKSEINQLNEVNRPTVKNFGERAVQAEKELKFYKQQQQDRDEEEGTINSYVSLQQEPGRQIRSVKVQSEVSDNTEISSKNLGNSDEKKDTEDNLLKENKETAQESEDFLIPLPINEDIPTNYGSTTASTVFDLDSDDVFLQKGAFDVFNNRQEEEERIILNDKLRRRVIEKKRPGDSGNYSYKRDRTKDGRSVYKDKYGNWVYFNAHNEVVISEKLNKKRRDLETIPTNEKTTAKIIFRNKDGDPVYIDDKHREVLYSRKKGRFGGKLKRNSQNSKYIIDDDKLSGTGNKVIKKGNNIYRLYAIDKESKNDTKYKGSVYKDVNDRNVRFYRNANEPIVPPIPLTADETGVLENNTYYRLSYIDRNGDYVYADKDNKNYFFMHDGVPINIKKTSKKEYRMDSDGNVMQITTE